MKKPEPDYSDISPWALLLFSIAYLSFVWSSIRLLVALFGGN